MKRIRPPMWLFVAGLSGIAIEGSACMERHDYYEIGSGGGGGAGNWTSSSGSINAGGDGGDFIPGGAAGCHVGSYSYDDDGDGYTEVEGDCSDCDPKINPGAIEVMTTPDAMGNLPEPIDENCNGFVDEAPTNCDTDLLLDSKEPLDAAKAIGLCDFVMDARWVLADGSPIPTDSTELAAFHLGHGILSKFGTNNDPLEGVRMLMLSSGTARNKDDGESIYRSFDKNYTSDIPYGFPKTGPFCPGVTSGPPHDAAGLQIKINVPTNALAASFDFQFFSYAWPDYVCTEFDDYFVALVEPFPKGLTEGNVAFDSLFYPIGINFAGMRACSCPDNPSNPCTAGGIAFQCDLGTKALAGTPFESDLVHPGWTHASTGWFRSMMPVTPGSILQIRFVTYDSGDGSLDSSTLIDHWQWYDNIYINPGSGPIEP